MPLQLQRGQIGLGRSQQMHGQKPLRQGRLVACKSVPLICVV
jgi:hypothetical protein